MSVSFQLNDNQISFTVQGKEIYEAAEIRNDLPSDYQNRSIFKNPVRIGFQPILEIAANKKISLCVRFDLNPPTIQDVAYTTRVNGGSVEVAYTLLSLPLYLVGELPRILDEIRIG